MDQREFDVFGRRLNKIREGRHKEDSLVRLIAVPLVVKRRPREITPGEFKRSVVDHTPVHRNERVRRLRVEAAIGRDRKERLARRILVSHGSGVAVKRGVGSLHDPGREPDGKRARRQGGRPEQLPFGLGEILHVERATAALARRRHSDRVVEIVAVIEHAVGFVGLGAEEPEGIWRAAKVGERDQNAKRSIIAPPDPVPLANAGRQVERVGHDSVEDVAAKQRLDPFGVPTVLEVGRLQERVQRNVAHPARIESILLRRWNRLIRPDMRQLAERMKRADRGSHAARRGAGHDRNANIVDRTVPPRRALCLLVCVERFEQKIEDAPGIRARRYRARHHQAEFESAIRRHGSPLSVRDAWRHFCGVRLQVFNVLRAIPSLKFAQLSIARRSWAAGRRRDNSLWSCRYGLAPKAASTLPGLPP